MVLKYAKAESKNIEMENKMAKNDAKMKEIAKERESMMNKFKNLKADQMKCRELFETRVITIFHNINTCVIYKFICAELLIAQIKSVQSA